MPARMGEHAERNRKAYERWIFAESFLSPDGEYLDGSGFANYGLWEPGTTSAREACENLLQRLLAYLPEPRGRVLDVACGLGATSRSLGRRFGPENVTGVNISETQLERCRLHAPGTSFLLMDATRLELPDASFDHVVCVEAAFHFDTREAFLRQALRVLKPGGWLLMSDILHDRWAERLNPLLVPANHLPGPEAYRRLLLRTGYRSVDVRDVTVESWERSNLHLARFLCARFRDGRLGRQAFNQMMAARLLRILGTRYYVVIAGRKPTTGLPSPSGEEDR